MDRNTIIANVTNVITIIKDAPEATTTIIAVGGIALARLSVIPHDLIYPSVSVTAIALTVLYRSNLRRLASAALSRLSRPVDGAQPDDFETVNNLVIITISPNGRTAKFVQKRTVRCLRQSTSYLYRFFPNPGYSKFRHNVGTIAVDTSQQSLTDINIRLDQPMKVGRTAIFELSCELHDVFERGTDYWCYNKYYKGKEDYELQIRFPKGKDPKALPASVSHKSEPDVVIKKHYPDITVRERRPTLLLKATDLDVNQQLKAFFTW